MSWWDSETEEGNFRGETASEGHFPQGIVGLTELEAWPQIISIPSKKLNQK